MTTLFFRLNQKGLFGRKLYETSHVVEEGKKLKPQRPGIMPQHPVILKRPSQPDHRSEQLQTLQSVRSVFSGISKESHRGGQDSRTIPGRAVQDGGGSRSGQNSQEWRRKGDKANWRARDREEEGGVVEVKKKGEKLSGRTESKQDRGQGKWRREEHLESASSRDGGRRLESGVREDLGKETLARDSYGGEGKRSPSKQEGHQRDAVKGKHNPTDRRAGKDTASHNEVHSHSHSYRSRREQGRELLEVADGEGATCGSQDRKSGGKSGERTGRDSASSQRQSELRARQIKDRNKSSRANHNRKNMADKKKRGGMI